MNIFNEITTKGNLRVGFAGNKNILSTIPFSLEPDNKSGIAPLEFPEGLSLFKTTAGLIHQGEASNLHPDQLVYPIDNIIFEGVEPRHQITDELVFVKPDQPDPPRQYPLLSNHELELQEMVYPDGTPKNTVPVDTTHIRQDLYKKHLMALRDIAKIPDGEVQEKARKNEMDNLLVSDPELFSALYNKQVVVQSKQNREEIKEPNRNIQANFTTPELINKYRSKSFNRAILDLQDEKQFEVFVADIRAIPLSEFDKEGRTSTKTASLYLTIKELKEDDFPISTLDLGRLANDRLNNTDLTGLIRKGGVKLTSLQKKFNKKS